jgi:hypothetical protein
MPRHKESACRLLAVRFHIEYPQSRQHYTHVNMTLPTENHPTVNHMMVAHFLPEYRAHVYYSRIGLLFLSRSQWTCGLGRGSAAVRLLELRVRIPPEAWMSVSYERRVLSGRVLCIGLITRSDKSYRV